MPVQIPLRAFEKHTCPGPTESASPGAGEEQADQGKLLGIHSFQAGTNIGKLPARLFPRSSPTPTLCNSVAQTTPTEWADGVGLTPESPVHPGLSNILSPKSLKEMLEFQYEPHTLNTTSRNF